MPPDLPAYVTAFLMALLGGVHCVGMCGGIVGALTFGLPPDKRNQFGGVLPYQLAYNLGRILSYGVAGAIMGGLGLLLAQFAPVQYAQKILLGIAGLFMVALGLYLGGWWFGLNRVEQAGSVLWRRIEPLGRRLLPVRTLGQALVLGLLWGWIPCGLVYSALILAVSAGGVLPGAGVMLAFGLGTLPNLLAMGFAVGAVAHLTQKPWVRQSAGAMVIAFGVITLWRAF
jgi:sulfite exporter TauE/SafE